MERSVLAFIVFGFKLTLELTLAMEQIPYVSKSNTIVNKKEF